MDINRGQFTDSTYTTRGRIFSRGWFFRTEVGCPETKTDPHLLGTVLHFYRYMYSDEVDLSGNNVMGVLYLAKKYIVPLLADKCTDYIIIHRLSADGRPPVGR